MCYGDGNDTERDNLRDKMLLVEYKPYDKVLVRCKADDQDDIWIATYFSHRYSHRENTYYVTSSGHEYFECIPFEHNAHLCGTNSNKICFPLNKEDGL